jgi:CheY-like chemotaxis protein
MQPLAHQSIAETILVADDQASKRKLLDELLAPQSFTVIVIPACTSAPDQLAHTQVDLVTLDVMMPRLTGVGACKKINSTPETYQMPVALVLSGNGY